MIRNTSTFVNGELAWQLSNFPVVQEESGALGVVEFAKEFDFNVKRVFFLRNIASGEHRGFHSHKDLKQLVICLNGSFVIKLDNGNEVEEVVMEADNTCLYLDGKVWREMHSFSENAVMVVLCDREYQFDEVVRSYDKFKENIKALNNDRL